MIPVATEISALATSAIIAGLLIVLIAYEVIRFSEFRDKIRRELAQGVDRPRAGTRRRRFPAWAAHVAGKVALVTGGARGIGHADGAGPPRARRLGRRARPDAAAAEEAAAGIGERALGIGGDVTDPAAMRCAVAERSSASAASTSPSRTPA